MKRLALALAFALAALPALAQTVLSTPSNFTYGSRAVQGPPGLMVGIDSVTNLPCVLASSLTCLLPTSSPGGSAGTPGGPIQTVQGVSGGTPQPVTSTTGSLTGIEDAASVQMTGAGAGVLTGSPLTTAGYPVVRVYVISNASAATLTPASSPDGGITYVAVSCRQIDANGAAESSSLSGTSGNRAYECPTDDKFQLTQVGAGVTTVRVVPKRTPYTRPNAGTLTVSGVASTDAACTISAIATGGAAVTAQASSASRRRIVVQNPTAAVSGVVAEPIYVRTDGTAVIDNTGIELPNGATYVVDGTAVPTGAISVIAATTGHKFVCKVQ